MQELIEQANQLREDIDAVRDEEQEAFDNMLESLQNGEKGEKAQAAIDAMDEAVGYLDDFTDSGAPDKLEEAAA
ncbi:hypothetical protein FSY45_24855 [Comamonas sp. Z1]|uniref:hypothetical protein n=1 Tax=Comamonas sp. Z1 TaxID=2601246 RepID=UPI0011E65768|nr:hypothetical protein [Comamonas sp. Z1]TYK70294.1 hypothetical protein FSY45_24855 [Comamonas sp. Z1]